MRKKILSTKVSVDFFNLLKTHPTFKENLKAVSPAFYFCKRVSRLQHSNKNQPVQVYSKYIHSIFVPYTSGAYLNYLQALRDLELIVFKDGGYSSSKNKTGQCRYYLVTDSCIELIIKSNLEYLNKLFNNKEERKKWQHRISAHKKNKITYKDYILDYINNIHNGLIFNQNSLDILNDNRLSLGAKENISSTLVNIIDRDYIPLKINEKDGRIYNDFIGMNSDGRKILKYNNLYYRAIIDIRACHPTFWASFVFNFLYVPSTYVLKKEDNKTKEVQLSTNIYNNILYNNNLPTTTSILPSPSYYPRYLNKELENKIECVQKLDINLVEKLVLEEKKWLNLFLDESVDPRCYIGEKINYDDDLIKDALNKTLNGHLAYKRLLLWWSMEFPELYKIWQESNIKMTGCNISKNYESILMLDPDLYKITETMDIRLAYEYDGVGIFADLDDTKIIDKIKFICNYLMDKSKEKFGFPIVLKFQLV